MKKQVASLMAILVLATISFAAATVLRASKSDAQSKTFTGEIMDNMCANMGSHDEMMKQMKSMGNDSKTCTLKCVELGGKFVLYDAAKKVTYKLDNQDKAKEFAGQKVKVTGTYDGETIHVEGIEPAS